MTAVRQCSDAELAATLLVIAGGRATLRDFECERPAEFATTVRLLGQGDKDCGEATFFLCGSCDRFASTHFVAEYVKSVKLRLPGRDDPDHSPGAANVLPGITCSIPGHCTDKTDLSPAETAAWTGAPGMAAYSEPAAPGRFRRDLARYAVTTEQERPAREHWLAVLAEVDGRHPLAAHSRETHAAAMGLLHVEAIAENHARASEGAWTVHVGRDGTAREFTDAQHFDTACDDRPHCTISQHHDLT